MDQDSDTLDHSDSGSLEVYMEDGYTNESISSNHMIEQDSNLEQLISRSGSFDCINDLDQLRHFLKSIGGQLGSAAADRPSMGLSHSVAKRLSKYLECLSTCQDRDMYNTLTEISTFFNTMHPFEHEKIIQSSNHPVHKLMQELIGRLHSLMAVFRNDNEILLSLYRVFDSILDAFSQMPTSNGVLYINSSIFPHSYIVDLIKTLCEQLNNSAIEYVDVIEQSIILLEKCSRIKNNNNVYISAIITSNGLTYALNMVCFLQPNIQKQLFKLVKNIFKRPFDYILEEQIESLAIQLCGLTQEESISKYVWSILSLVPSILEDERLGRVYLEILPKIDITLCSLLKSPDLRKYDFLPAMLELLSHIRFSKDYITILSSVVLIFTSLLSKHHVENMINSSESEPLMIESFFSFLSKVSAPSNRSFHDELKSSNIDFDQLIASVLEFTLNPLNYCFSIFSITLLVNLFNVIERKVSSDVSTKIGLLLYHNMRDFKSDPSYITLYNIYNMLEGITTNLNSQTVSTFDLFINNMMGKSVLDDLSFISRYVESHEQIDLNIENLINNERVSYLIFLLEQVVIERASWYHRNESKPHHQKGGKMFSIILKSDTGSFPMQIQVPMVSLGDLERLIIINCIERAEHSCTKNSGITFYHDREFRIPCNRSDLPLSHLNPKYSQFEVFYKIGHHVNDEAWIHHHCYCNAEMMANSKIITSLFYLIAKLSGGSCTGRGSLPLSLLCQRWIKDKTAQHVLCSVLPAWFPADESLIPFVISIDVRILVFRSMFLTIGHAIQCINSHSNRKLMANSDLGRIKRSVSREDDILVQGQSFFREIMVNDQMLSILEVEFDDEPGTGLGPTLEFYSLIGKRLRLEQSNLWYHSESNVGSSISDDSRGLFLQPSKQDKGKTEKLGFIGYLIARVILDNRRIDLLFHTLFLEILFGPIRGKKRKFSLTDMEEIDPSLYKSLMHISSIKDDTDVEKLGLEFTFPNDNAVLKGSIEEKIMVATVEDAQEYCKLVVRWMFNSGVEWQMNIIRESMIQMLGSRESIVALSRLFSNEEIAVMISGERNHVESWEDLLEAIQTDHGYTKDSVPVVNFCKVVAQFNRQEISKLISFLTGSTNLPVGGFKSLSPRLTIVKKQGPASMLDSTLPSVMTCANYLKLPAYSSMEILRERLLYAMTEGQFSFYLS